MNAHGQAVAEFALVLPVMALLMLAVFDVGWLLLSQYRATDAIATVADMYPADPEASALILARAGCPGAIVTETEAAGVILIEATCPYTSATSLLPDVFTVQSSAALP